MVKPKLTPLWTLLKLLLLLFLLCVIFAAIWLRQGPQPLNWAKPFVLRNLNTADAPYTVNFGDMAIDWRSLSRLGLVRVRQVTLSGRDGAVFASLPEMYASLDLLGFLPHRRMIYGIYVQQPRLFLTRDKEKNLRLGLQGNDSPMAPLAELEGNKSGKPSKPWNGSLPFRNLHIEKFYLVLADEVTGKRLTSSEGAITLMRRFGHYRGSVELPFTYGDEQGSLNATLRTVAREQHVLNVAIDRLPTDYICILATCPGGLDLSGILDGQLQVALDDRLRPYGGQGHLKAEGMTIAASEWLAEPLKLSRGELKLAAGDSMDRLHIEKLELALSDTNISATAEAQKKSDGWYLNGEAKADKLPIDKLYKYWPISLAPDSREWVTSALKDGYGENSSIRIAFTPKDFVNPNISDEAIDALVNARNITVHYLPGFPELKAVNGIVNFTGETIRIKADSGQVLSSTAVKTADILLPDLNKPATPMEIDVQLAGPASDAATLLKLDHFTFDDALELNPATIKGQFSGALKLKFDAFSADNPDAPPMPDGQINFDAVQYDIALKLSDIAQPKFAGNIDIAGAGGDLAATNAGMSFDGSVKIGGSTDLKVKVTQKAGEDVKLDLTGGIAREQFVALGIPDASYFGVGKMDLSADVTALKDTLRLNKGTIDLTDMALDVSEIGWTKRRGAPAVITVTPQGEAYGLDIKAQGLSAPNATLKLSNDLDVQELRIPRLRAGDSDFGVRYATLKDGFAVELTGNTLDASVSYNTPSRPGSENQLLANFPRMKLTIDLGALILMPNHPFSQVKGTLDCTGERCESANIAAQAGTSDIRATIGRDEQGRRFALTASDAGDFLRAVDITDRMHGGKLELAGYYDDKLTPAALPAKLNIKRFTLKNSEILGRILSIGSLTGLSNALTGSGIDVKSLTADLRHRKGKITITDGKLSANAMAISIGGKVDTVKSELDFKGTVVPAAMFNTLLGKIPLLGMLAGGDEGLIAFNFTVKGPYADPSVMVNPLSGLTPGFLRNIWGDKNPTIDDGEEEGATSEPEDAPARRHQRGIGQ